MSDERDIDTARFVFGPGTREGGADDRLGRFGTRATGPFDDEDDARDATARGARRLGRLAHMLEAHGRHGAVVVIQGMDAAGKDETIHHVLSAVAPGQVRARSFSRLSDREAAHVYLRRAFHALPARGRMAIFNRSCYERVIADRIHPENLEDQRLPPAMLAAAEDGSLWSQRFRQIRDFERYCVENGIEVIKLFLHVSKEAQRQRLLERLDRPEKRWDFDLVDVTERDHWDRYMEAYEDAFRATSVPAAPWYIIPADHKWFSRAATAAVITDRLARLHQSFPEPDPEARRDIEEGRRRLRQDG